MNAASLDVAAAPANLAERLRTIRLRLPGQAVKERIEIARATHGPLYTLGLVRESARRSSSPSRNTAM